MGGHVEFGAENAAPESVGVSLDGLFGDLEKLQNFLDVVMFLVENLLKVVLEILVHFEHFYLFKVQPLLYVESSAYFI